MTNTFSYKGWSLSTFIYAALAKPILVVTLIHMVVSSPMVVLKMMYGRLQILVENGPYLSTDQQWII
jgi:hypothetical protein